MDRKEWATTLAIFGIAIVVILVVGVSCTKDTFREQYGTIEDFRLIPGGFGQSRQCEITTNTTKVVGWGYDCDNLVVGKRISKEGNNCKSRMVIG